LNPGTVTRLNGVAANRTIRALAATDLPVGVRPLAAAAEVSPGSVSKLLVTLASEGFVDRDQNGGVVSVRRRALVRRWARDYSFARSNRSVGYYIAPRGLDRTLSRIDGRGAVAITGSAAARRYLPEAVTSVVPLRLLALYASDPAAVSAELGLIAAEPTTANVVIAVPQDAAILPAADQTGPAVAPLALCRCRLADTSRTLGGRGRTAHGRVGGHPQGVDGVRLSDAAPEYVTARRVLLDALSALQDHLDSLILVGAQAVVEVQLLLADQDAIGRRRSRIC
jgi:hypothetical protein